MVAGMAEMPVAMAVAVREVIAGMVALAPYPRVQGELALAEAAEAAVDHLQLLVALAFAGLLTLAVAALEFLAQARQEQGVRPAMLGAAEVAAEVAGRVEA